MSITPPVEYEDASKDIKEIYDDIMATRKTDWGNNFWKVLATQPDLLKRTWQGVKSVRSEGTLDSLTTEMIYIAVSMTNSCEYCIRSHTAAAKKKGMSDKMLKEIIAVVGMANETNRLVESYQVEVDEFLK